MVSPRAGFGGCDARRRRAPVELTTGAAQALPHGLRRDPADICHLRMIESGHSNEQQNFSRRCRQGRQCPFDATLQFARRGLLER
jgi:hypothetical protein